MRLILAVVATTVLCFGQQSGEPSYIAGKNTSYALSAANHQVATMITLPTDTTVASVLWWVASLTTADTVRVSIQTSSGFRPSGTILSSGTTSVATIGWYKTVLSSSVSLSAGTSYFVVFDFPSYSGGNLSVLTGSLGLLFSRSYRPLSMRFDGSAWTATYTDTQVPRIVLLDGNDKPVQSGWVAWSQHTTSILGTSERAALEFTATRAFKLRGVRWVRFDVSVGASALIRVYRNDVLMGEVAVPTFAGTAPLSTDQYALLPEVVHIGPGNRIKVVLQCVSGSVNIARVTQTDQPAEIRPFWQYLNPYFRYMANPVTGLANSSDVITNTTWWYALFPLVESYTNLGGGFVVQQ